MTLTSEARSLVISVWADLTKHRLHILTDDEFIGRLEGRLQIMMDLIRRAKERQEGVE
jgi:hypothetical protein